MFHRCRCVDKHVRLEGKPEFSHISTTTETASQSSLFEEDLAGGDSPTRLWSFWASPLERWIMDGQKFFLPSVRLTHFRDWPLCLVVGTEWLSVSYVDSSSIHLWSEFLWPINSRFSPLDYVHFRPSVTQAGGDFLRCDWRHYGLCWSGALRWMTRLIAGRLWSGERRGGDDTSWRGGRIVEAKLPAEDVSARLIHLCSPPPFSDSNAQHRFYYCCFCGECVSRSAIPTLSFCQ